MFWVFNIIDHEKNYYFDRQQMEIFCKMYNLPIVPLVANSFMGLLALNVQQAVELSKGKSLLADIPREGIVVRCIENGKKLLSFKVINPDFLLKYSD